jgi:hypothetical protein
VTYAPENDPGVARLLAARDAGASQEELDALELELIEQTDNRPTEADQAAELEAE